jgi:hypothetical protein
VLYVVTEAAGGGGEGEARDTESKTRTPHKDVGKNTRSDEMRNFAHQAHVGLHQSPARHRATPHIVPRSVILCHVVSQIRWPNWPA